MSSTEPNRKKVKNSRAKPQSTKRKEQREQFKDFILGEFHDLYEEFKENPSKFQNEEYAFIRDFHRLIISNPAKYPIYDAGPQPAAPAVAQTSLQRADLTPRYAQSIVDLAKPDYISASMNRVCSQPTLQVLDVGTEYREGQLHHQQKEPITYFSLVDGSSDRLLGKLSTNVSRRSHEIVTGAIMHVLLGTPITYHQQSAKAYRAGLLVISFDIVGSCDLITPREDVRPCYFGVEAADESTATEPSSRTVDIGPEWEPIPAPSEQCTTQKRLCTMAGVKMEGCICDCLPVVSLNLDAIKQNCYFVTNELSKNNSMKRNLIFWYYATNIYGFKGSYVHRLPECLEFAVRKAYPNKKGTAYKLYEDKDTRDMRKAGLM